MWRKRQLKDSETIARHFDIYMQGKGLAGTVKFNHEEEFLKIIANTDNTDDSSRVNDVRNLSGGERSFATLCLLLALGHVVS
jgi:chromosome segregation ATPase